jgi:eukaryotic-like serine/threonine-protein kinase
MLIANTIIQNRYRIIRQFGQGGMGTVYEAVDERLDTTVALKESHFTDEQLCKQFEREARLLAKLRHPAMTRVIDHFRDDDGQFLVMDFIAGEDLSEKLNRTENSLPPTEVLAWADQLLDALDYLHSQEPPVIHRDIKPQNLKLTAQNQIILLDFGLAKGFVGQMSRVTTSGSIFGYTPNYAPLEQIQGTGTDPRSDLYSLAATLYHLMTGIVPPDVLTRLTATTDGLSDPLRLAHEVRREVGADVATILNRAMAIGRNQRFANAAEMRQALLSTRSTGRLAKEARTPELPSTIVSPPEIVKPSQRKAHPNRLNPRNAGSVKEPLRIGSTIPSPVANPLASQQELASLLDAPSTTVFEEPVGNIDRFAMARKLGFFVMILIVVLILLALYFNALKG